MATGNEKGLHRVLSGRSGSGLICWSVASANDITVNLCLSRRNKGHFSTFLTISSRLPHALPPALEDGRIHNVTWRAAVKRLHQLFSSQHRHTGAGGNAGAG